MANNIGIPSLREIQQEQLNESKQQPNPIVTSFKSNESSNQNKGKRERNRNPKERTKGKVKFNFNDFLALW